MIEFSASLTRKRNEPVCVRLVQVKRRDLTATLATKSGAVRCDTHFKQRDYLPVVCRCMNYHLLFLTLPITGVSLHMVIRHNFGSKISKLKYTHKKNPSSHCSVYKSMLLRKSTLFFYMLSAWGLKPAPSFSMSYMGHVWKEASVHMDTRTENFLHERSSLAIFSAIPFICICSQGSYAVPNSLWKVRCWSPVKLKPLLTQMADSGQERTCDSLHGFFNTMWFNSDTSNTLNRATGDGSVSYVLHHQAPTHFLIRSLGYALPASSGMFLVVILSCNLVVSEVDQSMQRSPCRRPRGARRLHSTNFFTPPR